MNEEKNPAVSEKELEAIGRFSRRKLTAEEVYTFPVVLCDNDLDRDNECFTDAALEKLAVLFCGKTGIFDHDPRGEKQTARIYRCAVETEDGRLNHRGEPYKALKGWAYMVRTAANADLILEIEGGIKKEVSVGCAVGKRVCSVCGADRTEEGCGHLAGKRHQPDPVRMPLQHGTPAFVAADPGHQARPDAFAQTAAQFFQQFIAMGMT